MPEFLELVPPPQALARLMDHIHAIPSPEPVDTDEALGRITASTVVAPHPLPAFPRSTVDGYAVRAADTHGASDALPAYLQVVGEILMGVPAAVELRKGQCALIHTGGMLPAGADAVVMVEHTQSVRQGEVEIMRSLAEADNVIKVGEDVLEGQEVLPSGVRLRPAEIGGLLALGLTQVVVARRPRVGIISSGDELVSPHVQPALGQVRDINAYTLSALVEQTGGLPVRFGIQPDRAEELLVVARQAMEQCDVVVITAGSSASTRDLTAQVIDALGEPGVLVHGVNVRPGKPTILAICAGKVVIGLPGNPVSALVIASLFVTPVLEAMLGLRRTLPPAGVQAVLSLNLPSQAGREDWVPVRLVASPQGYLAEPVFGKSNLIFTLARADGLIRIPADANGLPAGARVEVVYM